MKVRLRNPDRVQEVSGPTIVLALLDRLHVVPGAVLVIHEMYFGFLPRAARRFADRREQGER